MPMKIHSVDGHEPQALHDFEGDAEFLLEGEPAYTVRGTGRVTGDSVRFHEKDVEHSGKDIRTWRVQRRGDGDYVAEQAAAF